MADLSFTLKTDGLCHIIIASKPWSPAIYTKRERSFSREGQKLDEQKCNHHFS